MDRWLARVERRFGRYALPNFTYYLIGAQVIVFGLGLMHPELIQMLQLDADKVMEGQVWRLVTWLAIPMSMSPFFALFVLLWFWTIGSSLEAEWGSFKYEVYWLVGILGTTIVGFALRVPVGNGHLIGSLFLAFATLWPNYTIYLFFILPVKVKYLALLDGAFILYSVGTYHGWQKAVPLIAVANYLIFFAPTLLQLLSGASKIARRAPARWQFQKDARPVERARRCAICGITNSDPNNEFRICGCEKCKVPTEYCLAHAQNH